MQEIKLFNTEEFKIEKAGQGQDQKVILKGNAMPLNETSRNGVYYRPESVKKAYKSLEGVPFLFAHQQNEVRHVLGKVEKVNIDNSYVTYEADIDPEEKEFIRKSEKGYIKHVSVGCLIDPSTVEFDEENQVAKVDIKEFCELSSAPVPGFKNTNAKLGKQNLVMLAESLGKEDMIKKLKETQDEEKPEETPSNPDEDEGSNDTSNDGEATQPKETEEGDKDKDEEDTPEDKEIEEEPKEEPKEETIKIEENEEEEGEEKTTEEQVSELNSKLNEMEGKINEVVNQIAVLESKVDTILDEAEDKDDKDKSDDEDDDEDGEDDEDDKEETQEDNEEDNENELEPVEEEFKTKEEPVQNLTEKKKALKIDKKSTEVNVDALIKKNRKY